MSATDSKHPLEIVGFPAPFVDRYRAEGLWSDETISQALIRTAEQYPDRLAVVTSAERWSYSELVRRSNNIAAGLLASGLTPGDAVLLQLTNSAQAISAWYGLLRAGVLPVCTLSIHRGHEIGQIAKLTGAVGHLVQADLPSFDLVEFAAQTSSDNPGIRTLLTIGAAPGTPGFRIEDFESREASADELATLDVIASYTSEARAGADIEAARSGQGAGRGVHCFPPGVS